MTDLDATLSRYRQRCEQALESRLPPAGQTRLHDAMRYACLGGGKRLRAVLVYAAGESCGAAWPALDAIATAVEIIHAYSLVHDDLPAMDDDAMRRGQPTCHCAYDDATAVLAGDALQSLAFEILATDHDIVLPAERRLRAVGELAAAAGGSGMAGGQSLDMIATEKPTDLDTLRRIHEQKTGALIRASCVLGGLASAKASTETVDALGQYGSALGLVFQVTDDILDVTQRSDVLGKSSGADERMQKSTYVSLLGIERAREECAKLHLLTLESAGRLGDNSPLFRQLADFVVNRTY